jgi:hypothetical protein
MRASRTKFISKTSTRSWSKKTFKEEFDDFDLSKYLKTKMKNQWMEKHKKVKELN